MNNNQGSSVFDGLLSVDLISVGFVPFPALLIEIRPFLPQAARSTGDLVGGGRDIHSKQQCTCSFACSMAEDGNADERFQLQFLSVPATCIVTT